MKRSVNAWAFADTYDFEATFATAKKLGFECIELNLDKDPGAHSFSMSSTEADYAAVRALIKKYGVDVRSVSTGMYWSSGAFGSDDPAKSGEAVSIMRKQIEIARGIGADSILVVTCIDEETGYLKSFENTIKVFRGMRDEFAASGINIGIENVWNRFFLSPFDAKYVLDAIDDPMVGIYFDLGNMVEFSRPNYWIEVIGKYIKKVHIKDFKRANGFNSGGIWCGLLEGDLDFEKCMPMLKAAGYDGPITAELFNGNPELSTEDFLKPIHDAVEKIVAMAK